MTYKLENAKRVKKTKTHTAYIFEDKVECHVCEDGSVIWYKNDVWHREDGPAFESGSFRMWYKNGKLHREDGPAYSGFDLDANENTIFIKCWYINGIEIKKDTYKKWLKDNQITLPLSPESQALFLITFG